MRSLSVAVLFVVFSSFGASAQTTVSPQPGNPFIGKDVHAVADKFGPPTGRKKMDNDEMLYVWELGPADPTAKRRRITDGNGGLYEDGETPGYITEDTRFCRLTVIASVEGIVTQMTAEDDDGTGAHKRSLRLLGSVCAERGLGR